MTNEEIKDLFDYFRLISYRDEGNMLLDEYDELNDIIARNKTAQKLERARLLLLEGKIKEEKYNDICYFYFNKLIDAKSLRDKGHSI